MYCGLHEGRYRDKRSAQNPKGQLSGMSKKNLRFLNRFSGALLGAGAAADADIRIDDVGLVALRNCLDGALLGAGAALYASIGNLVSHGFTSHYV